MKPQTCGISFVSEIARERPFKEASRLKEKTTKIRIAKRKIRFRDVCREIGFVFDFMCDSVCAPRIDNLPTLTTVLSLWFRFVFVSLVANLSNTAFFVASQIYTHTHAIVDYVCTAERVCGSAYTF